MRAFDILFTVVWVVVIYFIARFLGGRLINSSVKYRADLAAVFVVLAFVVGLLWPFSNRAVSNAPATQTVAATPPAICHRAPSHATVLRGIRETHGGDYGGSIDELLPDPKFPTTLTQFRSGCTIYASGWAANMGAKKPIPGGIGFLIDSKRVINASFSYGQPRPDVVQALGGPGLVFTGFGGAEIPTAGLRAGAHTIQIVALSKDGRFYHRSSQPTLITLR